MPTAIYFDCFSGISGDMALGALLDAGLPLDALRAELAKLNVAGWAIDAERGMRRYIAGTRARVHAPEQPTHRHLSDVRAIIEGSALAPQVKARSLHVFTLLAEAEGQIHGIPAEQVHFHEVGALDAIVDIVGVVAGLALLGVEEVYASPLPLGSGWTRAAHGQLPLPAPAVLALLAAADAPTIPDDAPIELVTPTGAALLAGLAAFRRPPMRVARIGYGLGMRDPERPNALRVWLGETSVVSTGTIYRARTWSVVADDRRPTAEERGARSEQQALDTALQQPTMYGGPSVAAPSVAAPSVAALSVAARPATDDHVSASADHGPRTTNHGPLTTDNTVLLETNIDDQPAEQLAYTVERLFELGALDAWLAPIQMKKGRAGTLLAALVPAELEDAAVTLIMRETTTLGLRRRAVERHVCEREIATVETPLGPVRVKRKRWRGEDLGAAPEYEDCARLARAHGLPLREVYQLVLEHVTG